MLAFCAQAMYKCPMTWAAWATRFLFTTALAFLSLLAVSEMFLSPVCVSAETQRGHEPQCQQDCLTHHSEKMSRLAQEYMKTGDKKQYQDQIESELQNYSRCLTNCREVLPIK